MPLERHHGAAELGGRLSSKRVDLVVGTRPEAIKLAPVAIALAERGLATRVLLTGQHPIDPAAFGFRAVDCRSLGCSAGSDPFAHAGEVARAAAVELADRPALVVVQGDTSSALGGALAAFAAAIPVAHVEAGLRTFDPATPWPEEEFRTAIDARADLLFAPTAASAGNLLRERAPGRVFVTGNTGIDALLALVGRLPEPAPRRRGPARLLVTCHRRESWGDGLESIARALVHLAGRHHLAVDMVLHPNPAVAETMRRLLGGNGVRLLAPLGHGEMVQAMREADILLSDSGGIQEEAPALGVPLLVLRDKTERPEGLATGNTMLVGTDSSRIVGNVIRLLDPGVRAAMGRRSFPFGDGQAAPRIAGHIDDFLAAGEESAAQARRA